jgi:hypothetical protein
MMFQCVEEYANVTPFTNRQQRNWADTAACSGRSANARTIAYEVRLLRSNGPCDKLAPFVLA